MKDTASQASPCGERVVAREILDSLPPEDPDAIRSRRDLRLINAVMGNYRWLAARSTHHRADAPTLSWTEIGAGDGQLAPAFSSQSRATLAVTGLDLSPRPPSWPSHWPWIQGDLFETLEDLGGDGLMASLFLHHFHAPELRELGRILRRFRVLLFTEPARHPMHHWQGRVLGPLVGTVTRHDLHVSIDAGFRHHELPHLLGLDPRSWRIRLRHSALGAYRLEASRDPLPSPRS